MSFTVYTKENCIWCTRAKSLLESKGIPFEEKLLGRDVTRDEFLTIYPNARTMPQIIREDGYVIGGFTQLDEYLNRPTLESGGGGW